MASTSMRFLFVAAVLAIAGCASSRSLDKSFSDLSANADLKGVLFTDRTRDYSDIDITVFEGRLMLTGTMRSEDGRKKLIENAWKANGVTQIIDEIFIGDKTPFGQGFEDTRIDQTLRARLLTSENVTSGNYKIAVSNGAIYLIGSANTQPEIDAAIAMARSISGVNQVVSHVTLRNPSQGQ